MKEEKIPKKNNLAELLAPAGTMAAFEAAIDAGADAVYAGVPILNARSLARDFTWDEIATMISYAHKNKRRLYLAMNSLLKEDEIPFAVESLARIAALEPDALIVQDLGIFALAKKYFPEIRLHASTLLGAHNSLAVSLFAGMGFSRIVLARELTVQEISLISARTGAELEVFVHGALCFSYSGLCLFSSSLGGKSSLRGRCVQPCRRRYTWEGKGGVGKGGYLFSMNDLCGLDYLHDLQEIGVSSFKIEGRLRSAHYVSSVVKAYRTVMDAPAGSKDAKDTAHELIRTALGRKTTDAFFMATKPVDAITPYHSGNIGLFLGTVDKVLRDGEVHIQLKDEVQTGDRLRLHHEQSGERHTFTLTTPGVSETIARTFPAGSLLPLKISAPVKKGDKLYKVDTRENRYQEGHIRVDAKNLRKMMERIPWKKMAGKICADIESRKKKVQPAVKGKGPRDKPVTLWIKLDDLKLLKQRLPVMPERLIVTLSKETLEQYFRDAPFLKPFLKIIVWELPPVIQEHELRFYQKAIDRLFKTGNKEWQLGHVGQGNLFRGKKMIRLHGSHTLNVLNSFTVDALRDLGMKHLQIASETDRGNLMMLAENRTGLGFMVYGKPPLFTSRMTAKHLQYNRPLISPKGEKYFLINKYGLTLAVPEHPVDLLHAVRELIASGLRYVLVDFSHLLLKNDEAGKIVMKIQKPGAPHRSNTFNYYNKLL